MPRPRRGSSNLGGDPRGDTSVSALATLDSRRDSAAGYSEEKDKHPKAHSRRRRIRRFFRKYKQISYRHTWLNPFLLLIIILGAYFSNPGPQNPLHHALYLSYNEGPKYPGGPNMYGKGKLDLVFVGFYVIFLSFTREFLMQRLIRPLAIKAGIRKRAKQSRFMEQVYTAMYFAVSGPFGLYVMRYSEGGGLWYFNTHNMFVDFPHRTHEAIFKSYYLLQASYWAQQAIVLMLQLEAPRKDFKELVLHHIVTLSLIGLSYRFHFMRMGIAVYITHDISDFFLATSKTLNYLDSFIVGPYFALFVGVWIYLRHYINLHILWATLTEFRTVGPYELNWETEQYKCLLSQVVTFGLLASLQAVNLFWLYLILRIAKNYVFNSVAQDERSENEDSDEEPEVTRKERTIEALENETGMHTDKPVLLINGEPANGVAKPEGIKQRKKA